MGLEILIKWAQETGNREELKKIVRKDVKGVPFENDIVVSLKLLKEIEKRAKLSEEHMAKAMRFERDISEYLEELDKRGVKYPGIPADVPIDPPMQKIIEPESIGESFIEKRANLEEQTPEPPKKDGEKESEGQ